MPAFPSSTNVFVRDHAASNKMVIDFARNIKDFALNQYTQVVPVKKVAGYYLEMTVEEAGRIQFSDLSNVVWPDGDTAPEGIEGLESFAWKAFETKLLDAHGRFAAELHEAVDHFACLAQRPRRCVNGKGRFITKQVTDHDAQDERNAWINTWN